MDEASDDGVQDEGENLQEGNREEHLVKKEKEIRIEKTKIARGAPLRACNPLFVQ